MRIHLYIPKLLVSRFYDNLSLMRTGNFKGCDFEIKNIYYKNIIDDGVEVSICVEDYYTLQEYIYNINSLSSLNPKTLI